MEANKRYGENIFRDMRGKRWPIPVREQSHVVARYVRKKLRRNEKQYYGVACRYHWAHEFRFAAYEVRY